MQKPFQSPRSGRLHQLPIAKPLPVDLSAEQAFERLASLPHVVFFDSADRSATGRYSFVAADPFAWYEYDKNERDPLQELDRQLARFQAEAIANLPPFQGGAAGLFSYELGTSLEDVPQAAGDDLPMPQLAFGLYDVVLAFDHQSKNHWIISQGFPESEPQARRERAESRIAQFRRRLDEVANASDVERIIEPPIVPAASLAPQFEVAEAGVTSNMSADRYRTCVDQAIEYIYAGDAYQVNFAQRLLAPAVSSAFELYQRLRKRNPAPYAGFLDLGGRQICSASPECFLRVRDRMVESRPIKGTRGRSPTPEADLFAGDELRFSGKDRAENVMIVDLVRNDLARVCVPSSVHVSELFAVETFAFVKHLVSAVHGELRLGISPVELFRAAFPGGSITGAPKIRAMEIISELEPTTRGAYCGSLAYVGFDGQMDASILIRTITAAHGWWQFPVGGGIVAASDPLDEYRETWHKARGMLDALR